MCTSLTVSFLADMHLRLTHARVPAPRTQPQKTPRTPAAAKSVRIVQGQDVSQRNKCSYSLHLFEQSNLGIDFLGDLLDPPIVLIDPLVQRFDFFQQRLQGIP